ncbi:hypothetical protein TSUD_292160 [Trifolium subterraneum]|uniref:Uncharacterized protein n=1 Tax=Trifolium subterraneum TaxID=3900 RepID=A0A2Z6N5L8_TRISU|nr:hypothetical protein TSUD_292160 [Trifolium subterraneum]
MTQILVEDNGNSLHMIEDERIVPKNTVNAKRISPQMAKVEDNATKTPINETSISPMKDEELIFAPLDASFADDAPLLPSRFCIIPLESGKVCFINCQTSSLFIFTFPPK